MNSLAEGLAIAGGVIALLGGVVGSSLGIGYAGSASTGALTLDPKRASSVYLLAALPMANVFFGLIVMLAFIIHVTSSPEIDLAKGIALFSLGLMAAGAEVFSGMKMGDVCAVGIAALPRTKGKIMLNALIISVYVSIIGILGMVFALMALALIG